MTTRILINEISFNIKKIISELRLPLVKFTIEPTKSNFGYVMCNISFVLAKRLHKKPFEVAQLISEQYKNYLNNLINGVEPHINGYINFFVNHHKLNEIILNNSYRANYGAINIGNKKLINVEHTSINPNKPIHIGHVRNIIIGDTLSRLLKKTNYEVKVLNYIDDSGVQVADLIVGFKYLGFDEQQQNSRFDVYCGDVVYVQTTAKYNTNPNLIKIRKQILQELENKNSSITKFANKITRKILSKQLETCWRLRATYDCLNFESHILHSGLWKSVFNKMKEMKLLTYEKSGKNLGCWIAQTQIDKSNNDKIMVRSDGTVTYIAKDLTYALWKLGIVKDPFNYKKYIIQNNNKILWETTLQQNLTRQKFSTNETITVIDTRQSYLQNIILDLTKKFSNKLVYVHLRYESVKLSKNTACKIGISSTGGPIQMSGRKGTYIIADHFLDLLRNNIMKKTRQRYKDLDDTTLFKLAENIAISTLRYEMIKIDLGKIITFDLDKSLDVDGNTAFYIQYAYARSSRILEKSKNVPNFNAAYNLLDSKYELELIKIIGEFDIHIADSVINLAPKIIANYCYKLATAFNLFYENNVILNLDDFKLANSRLCLVYSFNSTLKNALSLLGITATKFL